MNKNMNTMLVLSFYLVSRLLNNIVFNYLHIMYLPIIYCTMADCHHISTIEYYIRFLKIVFC